MAFEWGYTKEAGPHVWSEYFPAARGARQSPIDVSSYEALNDPTLSQSPLRYFYDSSCIKFLLNTGGGWKAEVTTEAPKGYVEGGPLLNRYRFEQFHFHWGRNDKTGSEHTVDGKSFSAEVHLVHWNEKYKSFAEAAGQPDGLAVLGTLIQVGKEHEELKKLLDLLPKISFKGDKVPVKQSFDLTSLLPDNTAYWTYPGSLTTPPCNESVTWILFKNPIEMSTKQLEQFRQLCSYCKGETCPDNEFNGYVQENYRPPLPVGDRTVREYLG